MGDAELFEIIVKGPGPFGFRLYGGEGDPLIVAKLRSRSKAHDAGLREGDVVLGINGQSCETISHGVAMALLESADDTLHLHLYRGSATKDSLSAAFQSLTSQLRPVAPGTVPPNRSIFTIHPEPEAAAAAAQPPADHHQPPPAQPPGHPHESASFSRQQEVTSLGANATQTITTDTETQDLGGVTLTKVTRQVVLETTSGGSGATWTQEPANRADNDATNVQRAATFHVPKISAQPLRWQPGSGSSATEDRERAVDRILINRPVTVDVSPVGGSGGGGEGKEGGEQSRVRAYAKVEGPREAQTTFKVPKTSAKPWIWQPSFVPDLPVREASPTLAFQILEASGAPQQSYENHVTREEESGRRGGGGRGGGRGGGGRSSDDPELSPDLIRALTTEPEDDWAAIMRRKKIFADSSFYDDPAQKYPTIEEQIKMARKVALSLSAPDNVTARGQRMFMKCKEKANQSTSDSVSLEGLYTHTLPKKGPGSGQTTRPKGTSTPEVGEPPSTTSRDLHYNPTPWKTPATTKKVERVTLDLRTKQVNVGGGGGGYGPPEDTHVSFTKTRAQFERGIRQNQTVQPPHYDRSGRKVHGGAPGGGSLAPQALHGLNDLKGMRGKGARLFAQRKAKLAEEEEEAEQRAAEHGGWQSEGETGLVRERSVERPGYDYPDPMDQASARRLQELISISKAYLAPWESTAGGQQHQQHQQQSGKGSATTEDHSLPIIRSIASEQKTSDGSLPSFLGKASGGGYRPVRFQLQSDNLYASHAGVSEF